MLVNFESLKDTSSVWIYQSNKEFSENEVRKISVKIKSFISTWKSHGKNLKASYTIKYNRFIVLLVDQSYTKVSGCAIDASVNLIKQLEKEFLVDLTNKLNVSFKDNTTIKIVGLSDFKKLFKQKKITVNTIVFNNMLTTKAEFVKNWEVIASKSWHKQFVI